MLVCWRLQSPTFHITICGAQGSKAIDPIWMGSIVFEKKTTVLLRVTRSCGHLEKLSIWPIIILLLPAWSHASSDHMFFAVVLAEWMSVLKSLFLARGWVEEKFMRWPHRRQNNYTPLSSLIWSWDQHLVSRKRTQTLEEMIHGGALDQKLHFKQNHRFLVVRQKCCKRGETRWLVPQ